MMMRYGLATALLLAAAIPANATTITGAIMFAGGSTNYYDPANGYVPAGYGNETSYIVPISIDYAEFGFQDSANFDFADFTETTLNIGDTVSEDASSWVQTFTADTPGFFDGISLVSNDFDGLTYDVTGDTLTVSWGGTETPGNLLASFTFSGGTDTPDVPEPASWALMISGFGLVGSSLRRVRASAVRFA